MLNRYFYKVEMKTLEKYFLREIFLVIVLVTVCLI